MTTQISFISDSQTIKGTVTYRTAYDLTVRIDQPYSGFKASSHIPSFGRQASSFDHGYGDEVQIALLKGLYDALSKLESQNKASSIGEIEKACERIQGLSESHVSIDRSKLKSAFKKGEITQSEYQCILRHDKNDRYAIDQQIHDIKLSVVEQYAPSTIGLISIEQAFDFLASRSRE